MKKRVRIANRKKFITRTALLLFLCFCLVSIPLNLIRADGFQERPYKEITVRPGDTLWDIAKSEDTGRDLREVVFEIDKVNGLSGRMIQPGETLRIPLAASE